MNGLNPLWPSLLPPICDPLWFKADLPKNEEAELGKYFNNVKLDVFWKKSVNFIFVASLEDEVEQEKLQLKEQSKNIRPTGYTFIVFTILACRQQIMTGLALTARTQRWTKRNRITMKPRTTRIWVIWQATQVTWSQHRQHGNASAQSVKSCIFWTGKNSVFFQDNFLTTSNSVKIKDDFFLMILD
jgi:hypothetical protein